MNDPLISLQNPIVKHFVKLRQSADYRRERQCVMLDGEKTIREAAFPILKLLYTHDQLPFADSFQGEKWEVSEAILKKISGMQSPEGLVAEVKMPTFVSLQKEKRVLALDGINDPGNMGTLLRTALAFNWETVYLLPGSCDPFNEKVLRAGRGAQFKLRLAQGNSQELQAWAKREHVQALSAQLQGKAPSEIARCDRLLLTLGNEARGVSHEISQWSDSISLAMPGDMESLNVAVAGGIILYLFSKN